MKLEVCANGINSALVAQAAGAHRVELCDNLLEGGTTPSYGQIALARKLLDIKLYPIIRPRGGNFVYTDVEFEVMKADIVNCKALGCDGVVFGLLHEDNTVDVERNKTLLTLAHPLPATFHRAFDDVSDMFQSLEQIIALGFERILTSGGAETAIAGAEIIKKLIEVAAGRIEIMPGAGVNERNVVGLIQSTGAQAIHGSFSRETPFRLTDADVVKSVSNDLSRM